MIYHFFLPSTLLRYIFSVMLPWVPFSSLNLVAHYTLYAPLLVYTFLVPETYILSCYPESHSQAHKCVNLPPRLNYNSESPTRDLAHCILFTFLKRK